MNIGTFFAFAAKLPVVISGIMAIAEKFKVSGADKKAAVISAIPDSVALLEFGIGMDLLNDAEVAAAISALIDAEAAALKLRVALKAVLVRKAPVEVPPVAA